MSEENMIFVGIANLNEAKRMKELLLERGVEIKLRHNKDTCRRGCYATVEIWTERENLPKIARFIDEEKAKLLEGLEYNPELANKVFDPESTEAICPACSTTFSTEEKSCPECGLVFIPED